MSGTFACIEKKVLKDGRHVAYKTYSKSHGKLVYKHFKRELKICKQLQTKHPYHPNVLYLLDYQETSTNYILVFDCFEQSLQSLLDKKDPFLAHQCLNQIAKGLAYLHQYAIIHCDLSPSNILINLSSWRMVICDFGCAHTMDELIDSSQEEIGTRLYKAPEHLFGNKQCSPSTDIWSLGAIFTQLLIGYPIFEGQSDIEQIARIVFRLEKPSEEIQETELSNCPDIHKLDFFTESEDEDEIEFDSEQEYAEFTSIRRPLSIVLEQENLPNEDCRLILGLLTWSMQERQDNFLSIINYHQTNSP
ncbi:kinase-like domain-containing protein [Choanephora cucurbitarum]|nr:kinase-like domain-containing protein [Choanephora cucurbitarum]